jgi:antitoxin ParD1/3/4
MPSRSKASARSISNVASSRFPKQLFRTRGIDTFDSWRYSQGVNVHLTPELEDLVQSKVKSGRFNSASELVGEALRLLQRREEIRERIEEGWQSAKRGELVDGDEAFNRIDGELEVMERAAHK